MAQCNFRAISGTGARKTGMLSCLYHWAKLME